MAKIGEQDAEGDSALGFLGFILHLHKGGGRGKASAQLEVAADTVVYSILVQYLCR